MIKKYEAFMTESNRIEGELKLYPPDVPAVEHVIEQCNDLKHPEKEDVLTLHAMLSADRPLEFKGEYRRCSVRVGGYICPAWEDVPALMDRYLTNWDAMDAWVAHNDFQKVHPFEDLNGRVGRLLWLWKMVEQDGETKAFALPFLHKYYYQTLTHQGL